MPTRKHFSWLVILILLFAAAARMYHLEAQSVWFDEGWSAYAAVQPTLIQAIEADPTNPPLYYLLLNLFTRAFGDSTLALRWVSSALGLLAIPLTYHLARRLFDQRSAVSAAFLAAFCPLLWWASQEMRMYTLLAVLVLLATIAWHKLIQRPARWAWLTLWLSELALLYAHNTGPVVALWLNLVTGLFWLSGFVWRDSGGASSAFSTRRSIMTWLLGQGGIALLWSPYFVNQFLLLPEANRAVGHTSPLNLTLVSQLWQAIWVGPWAMVGHEPVMIAASGVILVMGAVVIPWRRGAAGWLLIHILALVGGIWLGLAILGNEIHGRYLVMAIPLLMVLLGAGFTRRFAQPVCLALVACTFAASLHLATTNPAYQHDDARGMTQYYADQLSGEDTVLAWSYADRYELAYYWPRLGVKARRVTLPEGADLAQILPLLPQKGDVALNVWYTQRADYRGMMACILGNGTVNLPEQFSVYGMSNLLYRLPMLDLPELQSLDLSVTGIAQINAIGGIRPSTGEHGLCLPINLLLTTATMVDLKVVVIVKNGLGWEIARADALFADAAQQTTSQLPAGSGFTAYPLLRLPVGTPSGKYPIFLRVYDEQVQPSGYEVVSEGATAARDYQVATWEVLPGANWGQVNRSPELPITVQLPVNENLNLIAHNIVGGTFRNGDTLGLALLWDGTGSFPDLTLGDSAGRWSMLLPSTLTLHDSLTLDWREAIIPADAPSGTAEVRLPDGHLLGSYTIEPVPALYKLPEVETSLDVAVPGIGKLVGFTVKGDMGDRGQSFDLQLVWQAEGATEISYTIFAQLVTEQGNVLAQSDALPANGSRPTTGWRPGEYIVDDHVVTFHTDAAPGTARLIVGFYDAATGARVAITPTSDAIVLRQSIVVR